MHPILAIKAFFLILFGKPPPMESIFATSDQAQLPEPEAPEGLLPEGEPEPEAAASHPAVRPGDTQSLVAAFRHAAGTKCNSSLEAVVRTLEVALEFKPKGLRVLPQQLDFLYSQRP